VRLMQEGILRKYLKSRKIKESTIDEHVTYVRAMDGFLLNQESSSGIDRSNLRDIQTFLRQWKTDKKEKQVFLYALKSYGLATSNQDIIANVNRLLGNGPWLDRFEETLDEFVGEELRIKIIEAGGPIKQSSSTAKKAAWTKCMMNCLEANVDEKTCKKILTNNLHFKSPKSPSFKKLKRMYEKTGNIDDVLKHLHDKWKKRIGDGYGYDSPEYKYVEADPAIEAGKREGNIVYVSKVPYQVKEFLEAKDSKVKRYHYCHCGWVRDSIKQSEKEQVSPAFCYCSGGWHKVAFEGIFEQSLEVDVVKSVLKGDEMCTFAIHLPERVINEK
jgi:predicted hydrocarbon binding protein